MGRRSMRVSKRPARGSGLFDKLRDRMSLPVGAAPEPTGRW